VRIAQIAPLYESVPPALYGGTERVVHYLTEELVAQGHDVTLFASGDSQTSATLVPMSDRALRLGGGVVDQMACHMRMIEEVYRRADDFDLLHFHIDYLHFPTSARVGAARVTTLQLGGFRLCAPVERLTGSGLPPVTAMVAPET